MNRNGDLLSTWSGRALVASLALLIGLGVAGVGALLSNTYGAAQVAGNARQLHWTNATLGATGITRAAIAQAVFFSFEDVTDEDGRARAIAEARRNLESMADVQTSPNSAGGLETLIAEFLDSAHQTVDLAETGSPTEAEAMRLGIVEPLFETLTTELGARQAELELLVSTSESTAGMISRVTFVAIAFAIPAVAMIIFWLILRRRMRDREAEMETFLEAERALNRAKDEFIAGLSHELRTPLTTIVGFSEILREDPTIGPSAQEHLNLISASSADLSRMVNDLLTAARLDAEALTVQLQTLDVAEEIESATAPYVRAGESLHIQVPSVEVYADPLHVRQVVHNLVSNALRHGGEHVMITARSKSGSGLIVVADDGPGVPPELEERLFKRFFHRGRHALVAGSVGLGLAISNELARRMGGSLRYEKIGGWTTFTLRLPAVPVVEPESQEPVLAGSRSRE